MKYKFIIWKCIERGNGEYMIEFHTPYIEFYCSKNDICIGLGLIFIKFNFWIFKN